MVTMARLHTTFNSNSTYMNVIDYITDVRVTHVLHLCTDGGVIAGAVIAAIVIFILIVGLLYYVFSVRGYKLSDMSLPTKTAANVEVVRSYT